MLRTVASRTGVLQCPNCLQPQMVKFLQGGLPLWMLVAASQVLVRLRKAVSVGVVLTLGQVLTTTQPQRCCLGKWSRNDIMCALEGAPHYGYDLGPQAKSGRFALKLSEF